MFEGVYHFSFFAQHESVWVRRGGGQGVVTDGGRVFLMCCFDIAAILHIVESCSTIK